jgi:hypothetical protein
MRVTQWIWVADDRDVAIVEALVAKAGDGVQRAEFAAEVGLGLSDLERRLRRLERLGYVRGERCRGRRSRWSVTRMPRLDDEHPVCVYGPGPGGRSVFSLDPQAAPRAAAAYLAGAEVADLAARYATSPDTVRLHLRRQGVELRTGRPRRRPSRT